MANMVNNVYIIEGNKESIEKLDKIFQDVLNNDDNYYGSHWKGLDDFRCGWVHSVDVVDDRLEISTESKWCTDLDAILQIVRDVDPELKILWEYEEFGNAIWASNDIFRKYFTEMYYVDFGFDSEYYDDLEKLAECLSEYLETSINADWAEISKKVIEYNKTSDDWVGVYKKDLIND